MKISKESPPSRSKYDYDAILAMARANPGEWIKPEREYPHSLYASLARGNNSLFPLGEFEFRTSGNRYDLNGKRWCHLHIRLIPEDERESKANG